MLENGAESRTSGASVVRPHDWQKKLPDEKNVFWADYTPLAKQALPKKLTLQLRLPMSKKKAIRQSK